MIIDMDTELQRLIFISMEKMTSATPGKDGKNTENRSRKCGNLHLRKALLVAHVLQDMRNAYISDDYTKLLNTIRPDLSHCDAIKDDFNLNYAIKEHQDMFNDERQQQSDDIGEKLSTEVETVKPQPCTTNCDTTMSRTCHYTYPVPVSVNTEYVLSAGTVGSDEIFEFGDETPEVCQQVEVVSDDVSIDTAIEETSGVSRLELSMESVTIGITPTVTEKIETQVRSKCPLPRKKRPLPKELLEELETDKMTESAAKRVRFDDTVSASCSTTTSCSHHNTTTTTTQSRDTTVASLSSSSSGLQRCITTSSVTSQISSYCNNTPSPRVVVEVADHRLPLWDSWKLPATCRTNISDASCSISREKITNLRSSTSSLRSAHMPLIAC